MLVIVPKENNVLTGFMPNGHVNFVSTYVSAYSYEVKHIQIIVMRPLQYNMQT